MAKPTELNKNAHGAHSSSTVRLDDDSYSLSAHPFPSATANDKAKTNAFDWWERSILDQMQLEVPIIELMNVIGNHISMESIAAKLITQKVSNEMFNKFFQHDLFQPVCFTDSYNDKMAFEEEHIDNSPDHLSFC
jgi:hypothetical protein